MSETLNVLTTWTYKQKQLVELVPINPNGEITNLTRIQRMAINLFLQTINNQLLLKTVEKDEFGQLVFSVELGEFLDRLGMEDMKNLSYIINQLKELKSIEIVTENKVKFTSFVLFSEVNYDKEKDIYCDGIVSIYVYGGWMCYLKVRRKGCGSDNRSSFYNRADNTGRTERF